MSELRYYAVVIYQLPPPISHYLPRFLIKAARAKRQRCTEDEGDHQRTAVIKGIRLQWRQSAKNEKTKEAKWAAIREGKRKTATDLT